MQLCPPSCIVTSHNGTNTGLPCAQPNGNLHAASLFTILSHTSLPNRSLNMIALLHALLFNTSINEFGIHLDRASQSSLASTALMFEAKIFSMQSAKALWSKVWSLTLPESVKVFSLRMLGIPIKST